VIEREALSPIATAHAQTSTTMPYVYTAKSLEARSIQSPEYARRDIKGLTTGRLEELQFVGLASQSQVAYDGYVRNLPSFLKATAMGAKV